MVVRPVAVSASRSARASDSWAWRTSRPRWCRVRTTLEVIIRLAPACSATSCWVGGPAVCSNQPTAPSTVNWVAVSPSGCRRFSSSDRQARAACCSQNPARAADRSPVASRSFRGAAGDLALERGPGLAHVAAHPRAEVEPEQRDQWHGNPPRLVHRTRPAPAGSKTFSPVSSPPAGHTPMPTGSASLAGLLENRSLRPCGALLTAVVAAAGQADRVRAGAFAQRADG